MKIPKIYDGHAHLNVNKNTNVEQACNQLIRDLDESGVEKIVILPLVELGYTNEDMVKLAKREKRVIPFCTVNPLANDAVAQLKSLASSGPFKGLKLHPRLQKFSIQDPKMVPLMHACAELNYPVVIDCFPDRDLFEYKSLPLDYDQLCVKCPDTKIILSHIGGYKVLDAMVMARYHKNLYLDLSFSLLYYRGSSVSADIGYAIKNMKAQRVLFGSDYPDRSLKITVEDSLKEIDKMQLSEEWKEQILWKNLNALFSL